MLCAAIVLGVIVGAFWVAQIVFVHRHARWTYSPQQSEERDAKRSVSVIHPIKDLDFELDQNLDSWLHQDYPGPIEHIFSFQDPDDSALSVVQALPARHPGAKIKILINPLIPGLNGKTSNMVHGLGAADHDVIVFGDSDTRVQPDFILKMARPLENKKVGVTACGQINIGGRDFWTRFFTYIQNCEADFYWAFFSWLGFNVGITGASFAMKRDLIKKIGGLQGFGGSILEDLFLGNQIYRENLHIVVGPFVECHVDRLEKEKTINYFKRLSIGIRRHIPLEMLGFVAMMSWYWVLLIVALVSQDYPLFWLCLGFMGFRAATGLLQRPVTRNRLLPIDVAMPILFDLLMTFYLLVPFRSPYVNWRGIRYRMSVDGKIEDVYQTLS
jgi:ceramide glucosyltransferase